MEMIPLGNNVYTVCVNRIIIHLWHAADMAAWFAYPEDPSHQPIVEGDDPYEAVGRFLEALDELERGEAA